MRLNAVIATTGTRKGPQWARTERGDTYVPRKNMRAARLTIFHPVLPPYSHAFRHTATCEWQLSQLHRACGNAANKNW